MLPIRRSQLGAAIAALALATAGCGSSLTEAEVLARSGVTTSVADPADSSGATPGTLGLGSADSTPGATAGATTATRPLAGRPSPAGTSSTASAAVRPPAANAAAIGAKPGPHPATPNPSGAPGAGALPPPGAAGTPAGGGTGGACTTSESGPIVVGNVGNYSGAGGSSQAGFPVAVQMWAASVNRRGGICGRPVQVIVSDDGSDPARYGAAVRDLVENRKIVAFVGNGAVLSVQGGIEYHKTSGVPVIGNDCTSDIWFDSPILVPTCADPKVQGRGTIRNGVDLAGTTKFGYLYCREAKACRDAHNGIQAGGARDSGVQVLYEKDVSITQVDFTAECQGAQAAGVELFWVVADPATVSRAARSCARQGFHPKWIAGSVSFGPESISEKGLEDVIVMNPVFPFAGGSSPAIDEYERARETYAPQAHPGPALSIGWTSGKLFERLATQAAHDRGTITPATLVAAYPSIDGETLGGLMPGFHMTPQGARHQPCYYVLRGDGTGHGFVAPRGASAVCS
jgi:branched-chain amino acid transport system substrate-binding protein